MLKKIIQVVFLFTGGALGLRFLPPLYELINLSSNPWINNPYISVALGAALLFILSFLLSDYCVRLINWLEEVLFKLPVVDVLFGTFGLIIGLCVATLAGFAFNRLAIPIISNVIPGILSIILGYVGFRLGFKNREELLQLFSPKQATKKKLQEAALAQYKLLDTSVIIDGRIADIAATSFVDGILVVPQFVLTELQHIADSSDSLKRVRGRRGLDILRRLQEEHGSQLQIIEKDFSDIQEVDLKLVKLAKEMNAKIVTNDFNLNKVSEIHQVQVLNINDLANAVKQVIIPGENMQVVVIKDGKEHNQGVAYLDDGTMIVIEAGRPFIGQTIHVTVTSVLQTSAGKMIFAKPKED